MKYNRIDVGVAIAIVALVFILVAAPVLSAIMVMVNTQSRGNIVAKDGLSVLATPSGPVITFIDWGTLEPGIVQDYTIYVKNTGNKPLTLTMTTSNILPVGSTSYTWNRESYLLVAGAVIDANLTISVSSVAPEGPFNGTITLSGNR